jgi:ribonuclease BN (tRNA processing enzyme)
METIDTELANLETFFAPQYLDYPGGFKWENIDFQLVKTVHVRSNHHLVDSYGLYFTEGGNKIFITTDTTLVFEEFLPYYEQSDVIFHDCETQVNKSGVHAHYSELVLLPPSVKNKMWLYHYNTGDLPDCQKDGFFRVR